jgi:hypothetical protein
VYLFREFTKKWFSGWLIKFKYLKPS